VVISQNTVARHIENILTTQLGPYWTRQNNSIRWIVDAVTACHGARWT
jgi:hypothetical protein